MRRNSVLGAPRPTEYCVHDFPARTRPELLSSRNRPKMTLTGAISPAIYRLQAGFSQGERPWPLQRILLQRVWRARLTGGRSL